MRLRVGASGPLPVTVALEPSGMEYLLQSGDYFEFEGQHAPGKLIWSIGHEPDVITIGQEGGAARMWNSSGEEMSMIG